MSTLATLAWFDWLALVSCGLAVATDLRSRRIPNWLTATTAVVALGGHLASGLLGEGAVRPVWLALAGAATGLCVCAVLSFRGLLGFGDTKLMAAIGMCVGFPGVLHVIVYTMLAGGLVALVHGVRTGKLGIAAANVTERSRLGAGRIDEEGHQLNAMPYALAIALGTAWLVLARALPVLRLL